MMEASRTFDDVMAAWQRNVPQNASAHVALSALFDLMRQDISAAEKAQVMQHLMECPACVQTFDAMVHHETILTDASAEPVRLAAATRHDAEEELQVTEDEQHTVRFIRSFSEDGSTAFTIELQPERQQELEHAYVRVYANGDFIWRGQIIQGRLSWQLPSTILGRLSVRFEQPLA